MTHNYNTRSKKESVDTPPPTIFPPPDDTKDPEAEEEEVTPVTIYIDDILKNMHKKNDIASNPLIEILTSMANSELQSKRKLDEVKNKRKKKSKKDRDRDRDRETFGDAAVNAHDADKGESDSEEEEGVSLDTLLNKLEENDSDSDFEYDEYDEEYCEMWHEETMGIEDEEWDYFHELDKSKKKLYMEQFRELNKMNDKTPMRFKVIESHLPLQTKSIAMQKIMNLSQMDESTGEFYKNSQWMDTLMKVPFNKYHDFPVNNDSAPKEVSDFMSQLMKTMNSAIYGHKEAKCQILQVVGQSIRNPKSMGNVIAIQGPMGNGKTTLVKEGIAKALGRPFAFIALGGATDSSYFDGHNFTYEGSRHGKIVDILIQTKCMNPIFYFDELDKVSETYKGQEIIHLLTHLTDASQNNCFNDNYFTGIDFDLSKALFIFSFNDESMIDPILKDRMNVINTDGFKLNEKTIIAQKYLIPGIFKEHNITDEEIIFSKEVITNIIENYTNSEKGVRNLKRCITNIVSKINIWIMLNPEDRENLHYKLNDIKYPCNITLGITTALLKTKKSGPPSFMYL